MFQVYYLTKHHLHIALYANHFIPTVSILFCPHPSQPHALPTSTSTSSAPFPRLSPHCCLYQFVSCVCVCVCARTCKCVRRHVCVHVCEHVSCRPSLFPGPLFAPVATGKVPHCGQGINQNSFPSHQEAAHRTVLTQRAPLEDMWSPLAGEAARSNLGSSQIKDNKSN